MHELNANMSIQVKGKHSNITVLKNCHKQASLVKRKPVFHKKMAFFSFFKKKGGGAQALPQRRLPGAATCLAYAGSCRESLNLKA